jgi:DNA-binding GntR family transcriptional regulator
LSKREPPLAGSQSAARPDAPATRGDDAQSAPTPTISSPDLIFREVVQGLYSGSYVPGQRMVESDLTKKWNVSRGTVREALNRLSAEGIVTLNRHRGAAIRILNREEMRDILEVLELMIGMAARLAAKRISEDDNRQRFIESFEALLALRDRPDSFELVRARNRFYRTLALVGGNRELQTLLSRMHVHLVRVQLRAMQDNLVTDRFDDYRRVGEAVLAGDMRRAELAARRHVRATSEVLNQVAAR